MNNLYYMLVFSLLAITNAAAQDQVIFKDGRSIEGIVEIRHSLRGDFVIIGGEEIRANQIIEIRMHDGPYFYSRPVIYYSEKDKAELEKVAILRVKLKGSVDLYTYEGAEFDYAISSGSGIRVLQELPVGANTQEIFVYKIELLNAVGDCLDSGEIYESDLNKNTLIYLINRKNTCEDPGYIPLLEAEKRVRIRYVGGSVGKNIASISHQNITVRRDNITGEVDLLEKEGVGIEAAGFILNNLGNSEEVFWLAGVSFRTYQFELAPGGMSELRIDNNHYTEVNVSVGASYKRNIFGPLMIDVAAGPYVWLNTSANVDYFRRDTPGYKSNLGGSIGAGMFLSSNIYISIHDNAFIFIGANRHFLGSEATDENGAQGRFALSGGLSFRLSKTGFF